MSPLPFLGVSSLMNCRAFGRGFFLCPTQRVRGTARNWAVAAELAQLLIKIESQLLRLAWFETRSGERSSP
jgi:hypothetical protein